MEVIITEREELKVVGMIVQTSVNENKIPDLWNEFIPRLVELETISVPDCTLGICLYNEEEFQEGDSFAYMAAVVVKDDSIIPQGMEFRIIPKTKVAVFTHEGSLDLLGETYSYIYDEWLPASGYDIADSDELEWYDSRFIFGEDDSQMDIHIPIKDAVDDLSDDEIDELLKQSWFE